MPTIRNILCPDCGKTLGTVSVDQTKGQRYDPSAYVCRDCAATRKSAARAKGASVKAAKLKMIDNSSLTDEEKDLLREDLG